MPPVRSRVGFRRLTKQTLPQPAPVSPVCQDRVQLPPLGLGAVQTLAQVLNLVQQLAALAVPIGRQTFELVPQHADLDGLAVSGGVVPVF